jgi:arylsulfatase A-like enzyme
MTSPKDMARREFLGSALAATAGAALYHPDAQGATETSVQKPPNVVYVFADQWRAQATGYAGDTNAITPRLDRLAAESLNFENAVSGCPVCTPYRASLLTGQYWLTHGLFMNDICLQPKIPTLAEVFREAGYDTAYIGKWHLDGHGRSSFIPRERRHGFEYWKVLECTHNYNRSFYYGDTDEKREWEGYDAIAQTRDAQQYLRNRKHDKPFLLALSWGPPHAPYETAPERFRKLVQPENVILRSNVPQEQEEAARRDLAGYYAHIAALDECLGNLLDTLEECGLAEDTLFIFTSDHGDLLYSQGQQKKQQPYDESIRVPFLVRHPRRLGNNGRKLPTLINTPDIMPTLLGWCGLAIPEGVEGRDFSKALLAGEDPAVPAAMLTCVAPFGQWPRARGGREYRGIRTLTHTYVRDLNGPWLLFDNEHDPYQRENLCGRPEASDLQNRLDALLQQELDTRGDAFLPAEDYIEQWGYTVDETGTIPYTN